MTWYVGAPLTALLVLLQVSAAPAFTYGGVHADLLVVWLGCWATVRGRQEAMPLIPVAGLGLGLLGGEPLGASLLALLPIIALAALCEASPLRGRFGAALVTVLAGSLCYTFIHAGASLAGGSGVGPPLNLLRVAPRAAILDTITAAVWFWPLRLACGRQVRGGEFRRL